MSHQLGNGFVRITWANPKPGFAKSIVIHESEQLPDYMHLGAGCGEMQFDFMGRKECDEHMRLRVMPGETAGASTPATGRPAYQQRVIDESTALDTKIKALAAYIDTAEHFKTIDAAEQDRMKQQLSVMMDYFDILVLRIDAFPAAPARPTSGTVELETKSATDWDAA